jgi:N-acetylmuramoyl-L-alanine amidase
LENSVRFAGKVEKQFKSRVGRNSRGVKQAGLLVLWKTTMPSVLIEIGFLTNQKEEKYLNNKSGQVYIASAIFRAFKEYKQELESMD